MKIKYINKSFDYKKVMKVVKVATGLVILIVMFVTVSRGPKGITYKPETRGIVVEYNMESGLKTETKSKKNIETEIRKKKLITLEEIEGLIRECKERFIDITISDEQPIKLENSKKGIQTEFNKQKKVEFKTYGK